MAFPSVPTTLSPNPASGSTTTDGTEQTIASASSGVAGTYSLRVDGSNNADGDTIELRVYTSKSGDTTYLLEDYMSFSDGGKTWVVIGPYTTVSGIKFTIKKTAGSNHAYYCEVIQHG